MGLEESLAQVSSFVRDGDCSISIKFDHLEQQFDDKNRMLVLYSDIEYTAEEFHWQSALPTVKIPYRDPSLGFFIDGVIFSSVGVYSRAPGIVPDVDKRTLNARVVEEPKIDIVNVRNSTISIGYKRNAVQIIFKRNMKEYKVPIGIFLKALSNLPYSVILDRFAYKPQALLNGFPCSIPKGSEDLSRADTYGIESMEEPSIEECVDMVYAAITQVGSENKAVKYTTHWKVNRINSFLNNLHFKMQSKYEATLSVGHRAVGTYLDADICVPYFKRVVENVERLDRRGNKVVTQKITETVEEFKLPKGHYVTDDDAREIRRYDIDTLRVRTNRSFILQEATPMFFRAKGYKLVEDQPSIGAQAGDIIDDELLAKLNDTDLSYIEVFAPSGRKVLHRSGANVELGDFYTILNYLFTHTFLKKTDATQYEVSNRIILDYDKQVLMEVEQTYSDIVSAVIGSTALRNLLDAFPPLPSNRLSAYLRDSKHREIGQSDITNIMSRAISESKASALMRETPAAMMPVQKGQYGRLDSFHAPDSDKVGSVQQMTVLARINGDTGEIEAPYEKVVNGTPTGEIVYITAAKENNKYIAAWDCDFKDAQVLARYNGDVTTVDRERVDYRDPSPFCDMSISRMCIPFPGFSQPKRALMATKMNGQAVPVLFPERPMVSTGAETEVPCLYFTGRQILESCNVPVVEGEELELIGHKWEKNFVIYKFVFCETVFTFSVPFTATDKESLYSYNLNLSNGWKRYGLDDVVFYNHSCDIGEYEFWVRSKQGTLPLVSDHSKPAMALGVNLNVCYKTYGSSTVDDALVISDRLITDNTLSSIQIIKYTYKLKQGESFSGADWCPAMHQHVYASEPIIRISRDRKVKSKSEDGDADEVRTTIEREVLCKQEGEVVFIHQDKEAHEGEVWVATLHTAEIGDKTAGRHGNKSVIAKIVPEAMMPYDPKTGRTMDVVFTPLGLPSRMNLGQILEVALGFAMQRKGEKDGKRHVAVCTPFYPNIKQEISDIYKQEGLEPIRLFNPVYGKLTDRPVMTGVIYLMKLEQMSNLKVSAVGYPTAVDPVFGQPVDSINHNKGQAVGEMESWVLIAAGAHNILTSFHTWYSDDEVARKEYFAALEACGDDQDDPWDETRLDKSSHSVNKNALVTQMVLRMFGCDVETVNNRYVIQPLNMDDIEILSSAEEFSNGYERVKEYEWFKVRLAAPVINPFWVNNTPLHLILGVKSIRNLVKGKAYLDINRIYDRENCIVPASSVPEDERVAMLTGIEAVLELIKNTTVEDALIRLRTHYGSQNATTSAGGLSDSDVETLTPDAVIVDEDNLEDFSDLGSLADVPMDVADVMRFLEQMRRRGQELTSLIWYEMPIMPRIFRQTNLVGDREHEHSFQTQLKAICSSRATSQSIYDSLSALIGYGSTKQEDLVSIRGYFFGRGSQAGQHGKVRGSVLSKRVGFSGRSVIVPMEDPSISPFFIGLPWRVVCIELGKVLGIRLYKRNDDIAYDIASETKITTVAVKTLLVSEWQAIAESLGEFNPYLLHKHFPTASDDDLYFIYHYLRAIVKRIVEGEVRSDGMVKVKGEWVDPAKLPYGTTLDCAVAIAGRQPTLHKKSIRGYFVKLFDDYCMHIHPIVCAGYNADFDGDTMWDIQLFGDNKIEACKTLSVMQDLISEKDGSFTLELGQDIALGLYCATTFENNTEKFHGKKGDFHFFDNLEELRTQLEYGDLHYHEAVVFLNQETGNYYCSTAGRILVNGNVPQCFTQMPFTDPEGIAKAVLPDGSYEGFKELLHDTVWTTTNIRPAGREGGIKVAKVLLDTYNGFGDRTSIMTAQALYEIGLIAADVVSVSITLDDMSSSVDKTKYMEKPKVAATTLNSLYQLGLVTEESRKMATVHAWDTAKKAAQEEIIGSLDPTSNTYYMMYSGSRGKPDQVMQSVGFIGNISKTREVDIEYPILHGYGEGLNSLDLMQTAPSARIGVISTQAGTKDTGYATRQSVYMTSGLTIKGDDCGIGNSVETVQFDSDSLTVRWPDGHTTPVSGLIGEFVTEDTEDFETFRADFVRSGYMINETIAEKISQSAITSVTLLGRNEDITVSLEYNISQAWRKRMLEDYYSYALPFTDGMKITERTLDWITESGLHKIIAFHRETYENGIHFDREAYMAVDYDTSRYTAYLCGEHVDDETLYIGKVSEESPGLHYYKNLLTSEGTLTKKALDYLTKKKIRRVKFVDGRSIYFAYQLSLLFRDVIRGRQSVGLLHLDGDSCITEETIQSIEKYQLEYIPVRTGLTCLAVGGICSHCYGKSLSSNMFMNDGSNLGIASSQAMCEPLSQATLNVTHSGGKRDSGSGLVSGLSYYTRMLQGSMTTERTASLMERFASCSGYVKQNQHNKTFVEIVDDEGNNHSVLLTDADRLNVPNGAYVDKNDTIVAGLPDLTRYDGTDVFDAALRTRYMLLKEYHRIFQALNVSARNAEVLARAQTSICYLVGRGSNIKTKDTGEEAKNPTGNYKLTVSHQAQVVIWFTGIAGYGFENVANMLLMGLFTPNGLALNSCLGNLITGTPVGSTVAKFIPKRGASVSTKYKRSTFREMEENILSLERSGEFSTVLTLGAGDSGSGYSMDSEEEIFGKLLGAELPPVAVVESLEGETENMSIPAPAIEIISGDDVVAGPSAQESTKMEPQMVFDVEFVGVEEDADDSDSDAEKPSKSSAGDTTGSGISKMKLED